MKSLCGPLAAAGLILFTPDASAARTYRIGLLDEVQLENHNRPTSGDGAHSTGDGCATHHLGG